MSKSSKVISIILAILAVIVFCIYLFLSQVNKQIPRELEFPASGLSQSIFDSQNTKYQKNPSFTATHVFNNCPYQIDIAPTDSVNVGEYGQVYKISESSYFYLTEFPSQTSVDSVIRNELSQAVMIDADASKTAMDNYVYDEGYLNGFKADYYIDCMTVTNGSRSASVYIVGDVLTITDPERDHQYKMFIGVMNAKSTTEDYASAKAILDSVVGTFQYNDEVQRSLIAKEQALLLEEEKKKEQALANGETYIVSQTQETSENLIVSSDGSTTDFASEATVPTNQVPTNPVTRPDNDLIRDDAYIDNSQINTPTEADGAASGVVIPKQKTKVMTLDADYNKVTLYYNYSNVDNQISVTLQAPDEVTTYQPVSGGNGSYIFQLDIMEKGTWRVFVSGDAGTDSMRLLSEDMTAQE